MDFLKFDATDTDEAKVKRQLKIWDSKARFHFNFSVRIDLINGKHICTLMTEDEASLKKAVRGFPVLLHKEFKNSGSLAVCMFRGRKTAKFLCDTGLTEFICGYVSKDFADNFGIEYLEEDLSNFSVKALRKNNTMVQTIVNYKLLKTPVSIEEASDVQGQQQKTPSEYYPIFFDLPPSGFQRKHSSQQYNKLSPEDYTKELRKRYNIFYNAINSLYGENADCHFYCTNFIGDKKLPSQTESIKMEHFYNGPAALTKKAN